MQNFSRAETQMFFDKNIEPVGEVRSDQTFVVETADAVCGLIKSNEDTFANFDVLVRQMGGACPVTGPIFINGAKPGDCISITLERITPAPRTGTGWTAIIPGWGGLTQDMGYSIQDPLQPRTEMVEIGEKEATLALDGHEVRIPVQPFLGTVGVAPPLEKRMTLSQSRDYLGDVDIRAVRTGSRLTLPVHIEGAMLSMGDAHAAQGEAEITGIALEIEADVELSVAVRSRDEAEYGRFPILENEEYVGVVVGQMGVSLTDNIRAGYVDLVERLVQHHGYSKRGAYILVGQVGHIEVGNLISPFFSCWVSIPRQYLA